MGKINYLFPNIHTSISDRYFQMSLYAYCQNYRWL